MIYECVSNEIIRMMNHFAEDFSSGTIRIIFTVPGSNVDQNHDFFIFIRLVEILKYF